jgi:hypothetical protein
MAVRFLAACALLLGSCTAARAISPEALRRHIDVLAGDPFEGREPGPAGEAKTVSYIASRMQGFGLEPAGPRNSWYQPLEVQVRRPGEQTSLWQGRGKRSVRVALDRDEIVLIGRSPLETLTSAPVLFAGHGAVIPDRGVDQLAGSDVKGAIVLILYDSPSTPGFPFWASCGTPFWPPWSSSTGCAPPGPKRPSPRAG